MKVSRPERQVQQNPSEWNFKYKEKGPNIKFIRRNYLFWVLDLKHITIKVKSGGVGRRSKRCGKLTDGHQNCHGGHPVHSFTSSESVSTHFTFS